MTSGIYVLRFSSGKYYIGKSNDIERRWSEHWKKFADGKAAKNMQYEFNRCGYPTREILCEVHQDHIDVIEPCLIHNNWGPDILNTSRETPADDMHIDYMPLVQFSLGTLCRTMGMQTDKILQLETDLNIAKEYYEDDLESIKDGTALQIAEDTLELTKEELRDVKEQLRREKSRTWYQRLFNL